MNWFDYLSSSSGPLALTKLYLASIFSGPLGGLAINVVLILAFHAVTMFFLTLLFMKIVKRKREDKGINFLSGFIIYFSAIFLVLQSHVVDIILLSISLDSLKVFADPMHAFYYVVGLYTTVGSNYNPPLEWQGLALIIPFCGLFAFSLSGSALFTMLGVFLASARRSENQHGADEPDEDNPGN